MWRRLPGDWVTGPVRSAGRCAVSARGCGRSRGRARLDGRGRRVVGGTRGGWSVEPVGCASVAGSLSRSLDRLFPDCLEQSSDCLLVRFPWFYHSLVYELWSRFDIFFLVMSTSFVGTISGLHKLIQS